jgi:hypothetical protein
MRIEMHIKLRIAHFVVQARSFLFVIILLAFVLAVIESMLYASTLVSPNVRHLLSPEFLAQGEPQLLDDERFGHIPNPRFSEHDAWGFRNQQVSDEAAVVALGDSFTYGTGVSRENAWPQQFQSLSGIPTYNLGVPGWGPAQEFLLLGTAMKLNPKVIVVAMFGGNDLLDCYSFVYDKETLKTMRSQDTAMLATIAKLESTSHIAEEWQRARVRAPSRKATARSPAAVVVDLLRNRSRLYGLLRALRRISRPRTQTSVEIPEPSWESAKETARIAENLVFESKRSRTVFKVRHRLLAVNLDDPRIREGHRIAMEALERMSVSASERGIHFAVLLQPSKELTFFELVEQQKPNLGSVESWREYLLGVSNEMKIWENTKAFLRKNDIAFWDALPVLRSCLENGDQPFRIDDDGHLNSAGCLAIAKLVQTGINKIHN